MTNYQTGSVRIEFSGIAAPQGGILHAVVGENVYVNQEKKRIQLTVRPNPIHQILLKHYQGESTLTLQFEADEGRTIIIASGCSFSINRPPTRSPLS
jgi:hypothetical protein